MLIKKSILKNVSRILIAGLVVGLMILPSILPMIGSADSESVMMVRMDDREERINLLQRFDLEITEDYGAFALVKIPDSMLLSSSELKKIATPVDYTIGFDSIEFNPLEGVPQISPTLQYSDESSHIYILQFIGPVKNEWKAELETYGVEIYNYIPRYSFISYIPAESVNEVASLPFVNWVGLYEPAYKIAPDFDGLTGDVDINIYTLKGWDSTAIASELQANGVTIRDIYSLSENDVIAATAPADYISVIARMYGVQAIGRDYPAFLTNEDATWIQQSNITGSRPLNDHGVIGTGIIVTEMDSQLEVDHEMFYDPNNAVGPNHRKVVDMYVVGGGDLADGNYHGQHVAGSVLGDAPLTPGGTDWLTYNKYDGNAIGARLIFQDIDPTNDVRGSVSPPSDLTEGFLPSYNAGSRIHTNSWGGGSGYTGDALTIDDFTFNHPDYTVLFAMGNSGPGANTLSEQPEAKNAISVGAIENVNGPNGNQNDMADFSSRGYADDGRIKPTVLGVGDEITSAGQTDGTVGNSDDTGYSDMAGTSMATPNIAGQCAQIQQYFQDGYYPYGAPDASSSIHPSTALIKAILVNGAEEITGSEAYYNDNRYPNGDQGWGRTHLDDSLYFANDARKLKVFDNTSVPKCEVPAQFNATGQSLTYKIWVEDTTQNLEFTLVWTDYPGADNANPAIVNDLDLTVTAPNGDTYVGNVYTGTGPGHSVVNPTSADSNADWDTDGDIYDDINVVESVLLIPGYNTIQTGKYTLTVDAANIANTGTLGYQQFALVATGGLDITPPSFAGLESVSDDQTGTSLTLSWSAASDPATPITYNIYRSTTPGGEDFTTPTYCGVTGTTFQDTGLTEGVTYYYVVRAVDDAYNEDLNTIELSGTPTTGGPPTFDIPVHLGWNLISYPLLVSGDIETVLNDDVVWDYAQWYSPTDTGDHWKTHVVGRALNDLNSIDNTMGVWLHVTDVGDGYLTVSGDAPTSTAIPLSAGWNLVSYPASSSSVMNAAGLPSSVTKIGQYDSAATYLVSEVADWTANSFVPGNAYWIYSTADTTWTVTY